MMAQRRFEPEARQETNIQQVEVTENTWPGGEIKQLINARGILKKKRSKERQERGTPRMRGASRGVVRSRMA